MIGGSPISFGPISFGEGDSIYVVKTPAELVVEILDDSLSLDPVWRVGVGGFTDSPANQISVVDTAGQAPNPLYLLDYPSFQVLVRGEVNGYQSAYYKARNVFDVLLGCEPRVASNGDRWDGILAVGQPMFIGNDQLGRPLISCNFRAYMEPGQSPLSNRTPL